MRPSRALAGQVATILRRLVWLTPILWGALLTTLAFCQSPPKSATVLSTLPKDSDPLRLALVFNEHVPIRRGEKRMERGMIGYVWGAEGVGPDGIKNIPAPGVWHEYYVPWLSAPGNSPYYRPKWFRQHHPDWLLYRSNRRELAWSGNLFTLDYTNPDVQRYVASHWLLPALAHGYDGISFDHPLGYNNAGVAGHYSTAGRWVQQYTGAYQDPAYARAMATAVRDIADLVHRSYPSATITNNNSYNCRNDPAIWSAVLPGLTSLFDEQGFTNYGAAANPYIEAQPGTYCSNQWLSKVQALTRWDAAHLLTLDNQEPYAVSTDLTSVSPQARFDLQWALANYFLVKGPQTYFWWGGEQQYSYATFWQPEYSALAGIGSPHNGYYASQGVYMRAYTHGLVLVNPSPDKSVTFSFPPGTYQDLYGNPVATTSMPAHSGMVLLNTQVGR